MVNTHGILGTLGRGAWTLGKAATTAPARYHGPTLGGIAEGYLMQKHQQQQMQKWLVQQKTQDEQFLSRYEAITDRFVGQNRQIGAAPVIRATGLEYDKLERMIPTIIHSHKTQFKNVDATPVRLEDVTLVKSEQLAQVVQRNFIALNTKISYLGSRLQEKVMEMQTLESNMDIKIRQIAEQQQKTVESITSILDRQVADISIDLRRTFNDMEMNQKSISKLRVDLDRLMAGMNKPMGVHQARAPLGITQLDDEIEPPQGRNGYGAPELAMSYVGGMAGGAGLGLLGKLAGGASSLLSGATVGGLFYMYNELLNNAKTMSKDESFTARGRRHREAFARGKWPTMYEKWSYWDLKGHYGEPVDIEKFEEYSRKDAWRTKVVEPLGKRLEEMRSTNVAPQDERKEDPAKKKSLEKLFDSQNKRAAKDREFLEELKQQKDRLVVVEKKVDALESRFGFGTNIPKDLKIPEPIKPAIPPVFIPPKINIPPIPEKKPEHLGIDAYEKKLVKPLPRPMYLGGPPAVMLRAATPSSMKRFDFAGSMPPSTKIPQQNIEAGQITGTSKAMEALSGAGTLGVPTKRVVQGRTGPERGYAYQESEFFSVEDAMSALGGRSGGKFGMTESMAGSRRYRYGGSGGYRYGGSVSRPDAQPSYKPMSALTKMEGSFTGGIGGKFGSLKEQRARFANELKDPALRKRMAILAAAEVGTNADPESIRAVMETFVNRASAHGVSLREIITSAAYYQRYQDGGYNRKASTLAQNPDLARSFDTRISEVLAGSNDSNLGTHNASMGVARSARATQTVTKETASGETISRKDKWAFSRLHGAGTTRKEERWFRETQAAMQAEQERGSRYRMPGWKRGVEAAAKHEKTIQDVRWRKQQARASQGYYSVEDFMKGDPGGKFGVRGSVHQGSVHQRQRELAKTRKGQLQPKLVRQLEYASAMTGVQVEVWSGGQRMPGARGYVGSHRHDEGGAADLKLYRVIGGKKSYLDMRNREDRAIMEEFTARSVQAGATGVGAGQAYMGPSSIHIGGGKQTYWGGAPFIARAHATGIKSRRGFDLDQWFSARQEKIQEQAKAVPVPEKKRDKVQTATIAAKPKEEPRKTPVMNQANPQIQATKTGGAITQKSQTVMNQANPQIQANKSGGAITQKSQQKQERPPGEDKGTYTKKRSDDTASVGSPTDQSGSDSVGPLPGRDGTGSFSNHCFI